MKNELSLAFDRTMAEQRARLAVPLAAVRTVAIAIWFALGMLDIWIIAPWPLGLYLVSSCGVLAATFAMPKWRAHAAWSIAAVDVPFVFASQFFALGHEPSPGFTAALSVSIFLTVTLLSMLSFDRRLLVLVGAQATLASVTLIVVGGQELKHAVPMVLLVMSTAVIASSCRDIFESASAWNVSP